MVQFLRFLFLLIACCLQPYLSLAHAETQLIAKVGEVPITTFELQREVNKLLPLMVSFHGGVAPDKFAEIKRKAIGNLIEQGYKVCAAQRQGLTIPAQKVDDVIENAKKRMSPEAYQRAVAAEGLSEVRRSVERTLLAKAAEKRAVDDQLTITAEQVRDYYQQNKKKYFRPRQFRASHILVKVDPALSAAEKQALYEKAQSLLQRARAGEDFYNLAYYNSDDRTKYVGGDLGFFHAGQTVPEFEQALMNLEVGEVSDLVRTLYGYHIIKLTEENEPRQLEFSEVSAQIEEQLRTEQRQQLYQNWLDSLQATCKVERLAE